MNEKKDGGFKSRKFIMVILTMGFVLVGAIIAMFSAGFAGNYPTYVGGILGGAGLYLAGNVSNDFLASKTKAQIEVAKINHPAPVDSKKINEETSDNNNGE